MSGREYAIYDGQNCIGSFVVNERTGKAKAFDAAGRPIGTFDDYDAARHGVNHAYSDVVTRKARTAEALKQLAEPFSFVSGLPSHFLDASPRRRLVKSAGPRQ
jgi:hypothetical protein